MDWLMTGTTRQTSKNDTESPIFFSSEWETNSHLKETNSSQCKENNKQNAGEAMSEWDRQLLKLTQNLSAEEKKNIAAYINFLIQQKEEAEGKPNKKAKNQKSSYYQTGEDAASRELA